MTEYVVVIVSGTRSDVNNHMSHQTLVSALHLIMISQYSKCQETCSLVIQRRRFAP